MRKIDALIKIAILLLVLGHGSKSFSAAGARGPIQFAAASASSKSFYDGKRIVVLAGTAPGGGYDLYARLLARHMGKHMPGKPNFAVENMDGAGGLVAANHLAKRIKPDGLTFMIFNHIIIIRQLAGDPNVLFDVRKMNWIGTASDSPNLCLVRHNVRYQRVEEMIGGKEPVILGATPASTREYYPKIIKEVTGANFKIITGYKSGGSIYVALENGEIDGMCGIGWDSLKAERPQWIQDKFATIFLQLNPVEKIPDLPNVPWIMDYAKTPANRQLVEAAMGTQAIVRSFVAPAAVARERVEMLRGAFAATMKDPEFLADAAKSKTDIHSHPGSKVEELIKRWFNTPRDQVDKIRQIYFPSGF